MTDRFESENPEDEVDAEQAVPGRRILGKKLVLFIALPMLLIGLTGVGIYFSGLADSLIGIEAQENGMLAEEETGPSVYYDLPDMLVNLNMSGRRTGYLKISVSLEVGSEDDLEKLESILPRIVDNFQVYLRELRVEDLNGSAGLQRLREDLLLRVTNAAAPAVVKDVLFRELLIQ